MAEVSVTVNERDYTVACEDGEEERVIELAGVVNARVRDLAERIGQVGEARLLLMAAMLVADELSEAQSVRDELDAAAEGEVLDSLAGRLELIAARLEKA